MIEREKLLQVKEVVEEINRHKWLQSEMAGYDIGFDQAASDWFQRHANAWVVHHLPKNGKSSNKPNKK